MWNKNLFIYSAKNIALQINLFYWKLGKVTILVLDILIFGLRFDPLPQKNIN